MEAGKEDDTMSAVARNYSYQVIVNKKSENKKAEPTVSLEFLKQCCKDVAKYLPQKNGK